MRPLLPRRVCIEMAQGVKPSHLAVPPSSRPHSYCPGEHAWVRPKAPGFVQTASSSSAVRVSLACTLSYSPVWRTARREHSRPHPTRPASLKPSCRGRETMQAMTLALAGPRNMPSLPVQLQASPPRVSARPAPDGGVPPPSPQHLSHLSSVYSPPSSPQGANQGVPHDKRTWRVCARCSLSLPSPTPPLFPP